MEGPRELFNFFYVFLNYGGVFMAEVAIELCTVRLSMKARLKTKLLTRDIVDLCLIPYSRLLIDATTESDDESLQSQIPLTYDDQPEHTH